jgi:hypothetical protein
MPGVGSTRRSGLCTVQRMPASIPSRLLGAQVCAGHVGDPLGQLSSWIRQEHRLIYRVSGDGVEIAVCRFHDGK